MTRPTTALHRPITPVTLAGLAIALAAACDGSGSAADSKVQYMVERGAAAREAPVGLARVAPETPALAGAADALAPLPAQDSAGARMLIRSGRAFIRVDSLEPAMDAVRRLATSLGGHVGDVSVNAGEMQVRFAELVLRIPVSRFDAAFAGLAPIGVLESSSISAQDVGEEFVDVNARMSNSRRLEDRLVTLLSTRTGKLEDVLAVERELARVRQEIERYEARVRYLRTNVALSTIAVVVSEREPLVGPGPGQNPIVEAFKGAWRNFVGLVATAIRSLGVLIPLAVALWLALRLFRRRRREPV